jgi:hypothetical protein
MARFGRAGVAGIEVAIVRASAIGSQLRGTALHISDCSATEATGGYRSGAKLAY